MERSRGSKRGDQARWRWTNRKRERERGRVGGGGLTGISKRRALVVISYGSAVTRGAFPSVDPFALPILTSPKSLYPPLLPGIRNNRNFTARSREREIPRLRGNHD